MYRGTAHCVFKLAYHGGRPARRVDWLDRRRLRISSASCGWAQTLALKAIAIFTFSTLAGGSLAPQVALAALKLRWLRAVVTEGILDVSIPATAVIRLTTLWFAILIGRDIPLWPNASQQSYLRMIWPKTKLHWLGPTQRDG
jgi:hypothetical protein